MSAQSITAQSVSTLSMPRLLLHLEGVALLAAALVLYANQGFSWWTFAWMLLLPDIPLFLYPINQRIGSVAYNLVHTIIVPIAVGLFSLLNGSELGLQIALIWLAHIGMDHAVGYGFKYLGNMKETHFARV